MAQRVAQRSRRGAGEDGDDELLGPQRGRDLPTHLAEHLGLDGQHDHVGRLDSLAVRGGRTDAVAVGELLTPLGTRLAGDDLGSRELLADKQAGDHRFGHHAGAYRRDGRPLE
jgi:hypothetical protein